MITLCLYRLLEPVHDLAIQAAMVRLRQPFELRFQFLGYPQRVAHFANHVRQGSG